MRGGFLLALFSGSACTPSLGHPDPIAASFASESAWCTLSRNGLFVETDPESGDLLAHFRISPPKGRVAAFGCSRSDRGSTIQLYDAGRRMFSTSMLDRDEAIAREGTECSDCVGFESGAMGVLYSKGSDINVDVNGIHFRVELGVPPTSAFLGKTALYVATSSISAYDFSGTFLWAARLDLGAPEIAGSDPVLTVVGSNGAAVFSPGGRLLWRKAIPSVNTAIVDDGILVVLFGQRTGSQDRNLISFGEASALALAAFDSVTGSVLWVRRLENACPRFAFRKGMVALANILAERGQSDVMVLEGKSGALAWSAGPFGNCPELGIAVHSVMVVDSRGTVAHSLEAGTELWRRAGSLPPRD